MMISPERPAAVLDAGLEPLLQAYPYKPYQAYARLFGADAVTTMFVSALDSHLQADASDYLVLRDGERVLGLALWAHMALESREFGFPAVRLDYLLAAGDDYAAQRRVKEALLDALMPQFQSRGIRHVSIRVAAADLSSVHALERHGFLHTDGLITYGRDLHADAWVVPTSDRFSVRPALPADLPGLATLASSSFIYDRLHADPAVPRAASDRIHALWLEQSLASGNADQVLVAVDEEGVLGYSVYRVSEATTPYFGSPWGMWVIAATAARGRIMGVARTLCLVMFDRQRAAGVRIVEGGTQLANVASARLHESCGFRVVSTSLSFSTYLGERS